MLEVPELHPRAEGKGKLDCKVGAGQVCSIQPRGVPRWPRAPGSTGEAHHQPACLTEMGWATRVAGQQIKKGHIFASSSYPPTPHSLVSETTK